MLFFELLLKMVALVLYYIVLDIVWLNIYRGTIFCPYKNMTKLMKRNNNVCCAFVANGFYVLQSILIKCYNLL
jgi:hypothetical protein